MRSPVSFDPASLTRTGTSPSPLTDRPLILAQRAIEEPPAKEPEEKEKGKGKEEEREKTEEAQAGAAGEAGETGEAGEAGTETQREQPVPPAELGLGEPAGSAPKPKSAVRALLLSAALPGLGELYLGSNRAYLFMGAEAVSWVTWASFRASADSKEDEIFEFAGLDSVGGNFAIPAFAEMCPRMRFSSGQTCGDAIAEIRRFWVEDRKEYYEIISKNPIYRYGWGAVEFENTYVNASEPPQPGTEEYRVWIANQAAAQDRGYADYNSLRDDRNDLSTTARRMTIVMLLNRVASAWHAFALAGGLNARIGDEVGVELDVEPSFAGPRARVMVSRAF